MSMIFLDLWWHLKQANWSEISPSYDFSFELKCSALADEIDDDQINSRALIKNMRRQSLDGFFEKDGEEFFKDFFKEDYESVPQSTKE